MLLGVCPRINTTVPYYLVGLQSRILRNTSSFFFYLIINYIFIIILHYYSPIIINIIIYNTFVLYYSV